MSLILPVLCVSYSSYDDLFSGEIVKNFSLFFFSLLLREIENLPYNMGVFLPALVLYIKYYLLLKIFMVAPQQCCLQ